MLDDAIDLINGNEHGYDVAIFTRSGPMAETFRRNIEAGHIGIDMPITVPLPMFPLASNKKSIAGGGGSIFYGKPWGQLLHATQDGHGAVCCGCRIACFGFSNTESRSKYLQKPNRDFEPRRHTNRPRIILWRLWFIGCK